MEEEREGMNGWGRRAEGQVQPATQSCLWVGLCFLLSLLLPGSVYSIRRSTQAGHHACGDGETHTHWAGGGQIRIQRNTICKNSVGKAEKGIA